MRQRTTTVNIYKYDELSDKAKEKAREWWCDAACSDEWWEYTYEDAEQISMKITGFDIDRGDFIEAHYLDDAFHTADQIIQEHGDVCETHKYAKEFLKEFDILEKQRSKADTDEDNDDEAWTKADEAIDHLIEKFTDDIHGEYLTSLRSAYEDYYSDEVVTENIICNEYEFLEDGSRA